MTKDNRDDALTSFFIERLCEEADLVFRLSYALTLNRESANSLVKETYRRLLGELPSLLDKDTAFIRMRMTSVCWDCFNLKKPDAPNDGTPMGQFLSPMREATRAVAAVCEAGGLTADETARALDIEPEMVRKSLADVRKALIEFYK